jgi:serine/threonine protein kinase
MGIDRPSESQDSDLPSARYSAPEMLDDDDDSPKTASDMWSLGCIIYEVLSLLSSTSEVHIFAGSFWKSSILSDSQ